MVAAAVVARTPRSAVWRVHFPTLLCSLVSHTQVEMKGRKANINEIPIIYVVHIFV